MTLAQILNAKKTLTQYLDEGYEFSPYSQGKGIVHEAGVIFIDEDVRITEKLYIGNSRQDCEDMYLLLCFFYDAYKFGKKAERKDFERLLNEKAG